MFVEACLNEYGELVGVKSSEAVSKFVIYKVR